MLNWLRNYVRRWPWWARYPVLVLGAVAIFLGMVFFAAIRFTHETLRRRIGYRVWLIWGGIAAVLILLLTGQLWNILTQVATLFLIVLGLWIILRPLFHRGRREERRR
jgi:H+/Cl- antiporter ClcA